MKDERRAWATAFSMSWKIVSSESLLNLRWVTQLHERFAVVSYVSSRSL